MKPFAVGSGMAGWWRPWDTVTFVRAEPLRPSAPSAPSSSMERVWQDRMHPAPIALSGLKPHQLNFGLSAALKNKTIVSNNTQAATRSRRASASCCGRLGRGSVTSHQHTASCKVTVPVLTTGGQGTRVPTPGRPLGGLTGLGVTGLGTGKAASSSTLGNCWEDFQMPPLGS